MLALPCRPAFACCVVRPVGTISVCCGAAVNEITLSVSSIDCVEKLHDSTTSAGFVPVACAIPRCALKSWQTCLCVASVKVLQSAGAALMFA